VPSLDLLTQCALEDRSKFRRSADRCIPRWLAPKVDGSDLIQDTFVELLGSSKVFFEDRRKCRALISVSLKNNLRDTIRKFLSNKRDARRERCAGSGYATVSHVSKPTVELAIARQRLIDSVFTRLPLAYRSVLEAYYLEGATQEEIGERLNRSKDAVRMLLRRAESAAQTILRTDGYSSPSL
jgi:RNA polymerase sigma factor (sigma-70 family)